MSSVESSPLHPHQRDGRNETPVLDAEGRCLICVRELLQEELAETGDRLYRFSAAIAALMGRWDMRVREGAHSERAAWRIAIDEVREATGVVAGVGYDLTDYDRDAQERANVRIADDFNAGQAAARAAASGETT